MSGRNYERLPIEEFGRHLITTGDLDPVYIALRNMPIGPKQRARWLIAYWCFYHCGAASMLSEHEGAGFWTNMLVAAQNEIPAPNGGRWPRGHERRHARGQQGIKMVQHLRERYGARPEEMVTRLQDFSKGGVAFERLAVEVKRHVLFGPWISFKVGDMLERVCGAPVNFDEAAVFMFKDPVKATEMLWRKKTGAPDNAKPRDMHRVIHEAVAHLKAEFADLKAPPLEDRAVDLQEVETVLCKWKSHMNGHYPLFNDIDEIHAGLPGWGETANKFLAAMPKGSAEWKAHWDHNNGQGVNV